MFIYILQYSITVVHKFTSCYLFCRILFCKIRITLNPGPILACTIDGKVFSIEGKNVHYWNLKYFLFNQQKLMEWEDYLKLADKNYYTTRLMY